MPGHRKHDDYIRHPRRDRMDEERTNDPYRAARKWSEPTTCPGCGAIFHEGRWQRGQPQAGAEQHLCPACQRIRDHLPAGELTLSGKFFQEHRNEILHLVHNVEATQRVEHALQRIMEVTQEAERCVITFTDAHLTRRIGKALRNAYDGKLASRNTDAGDLVRVSWTR